jgi:hypothetical protein
MGRKKGRKRRGAFIKHMVKKEKTKITAPPITRPLRVIIDFG